MKHIDLTFLFLLMLVPKIVVAQEALPPGVVDFMSRYQAAVNNNDMSELKALTHPASLKCITEKTEAYFEEYFLKEANQTIPAGSKLKRFSGEFSMPGLFDYPVPSELQMQFDSPKLTVVRQLARHNGEWKMVVACPTEKALMLYQRKKAKEAANKTPLPQ